MKKVMSLKKIFIFCIVIIALYKIIMLLDTLPPMFLYGDITYHIAESILYVINQLAIGVAGAIIFYYLNSFYNTKLNMALYYDLRKNILFILYHHMDILKNVDYFKELGDKTQFLWPDCIVLLSIIDKSLEVDDGYVYDKDAESQSDYEIKYKYEQAVGEYLLQVNQSNLIHSIEQFNKPIDDLRACISSYGINNLSSFYQLKGGKDIIDTVTSDFYCDDLIGYTDCLKYDDSQEKENLIIFRKYIGLYYLQFLNETIDFYNAINEFIETVEKNKIIKYTNLIY